MKPIIYFRRSLTPKEEIEACQKAGLDFTFSNVISNKLVVGRYSVLPFYRDLYEDLRIQGSQLINSPLDHTYIANFDYYHDLSDKTFKSYLRLQDIPQDGGPFVVKGVTNSQKHNWNKKMFAKNKKEAIEIAIDLRQDTLIGTQDIVVREFVELEKVDEGLNGLPMSNEWRFFFYKNNLLSYGFYWSSTDKRGILDNQGIEFAKSVAEIVKESTNLFVVDIAKTKDGKWILVELNDGQMAGLSENNFLEFYTNLKKVLDEEQK